MRVVVAIDKFKGSLTASEAAAAVSSGVRAVWPDAEAVVVPVGDGGDGTLEAAVRAGFTLVPVECAGPTGEVVETGYAIRDGVAVVELADACGLLRLPVVDGELMLDGFGSSTLGLGQVMAAALDAGAEQLVVGLGGSASTDGGAGMLTGLGARLLTEGGGEVAPGLEGLADLARVDLSELHPRLGEVDLVMASDVDNPLLGDRGAAAVFGPQKGVAGADIARADQLLGRLADLVEAQRGSGSRGRAGAGAAGGTGWALLVLAAQAHRGIDVVLDWSRADQVLAGADLVITGEGSLDEQSLGGKTPIGVADAAQRHGVPVAAVSGRRTITDEQLSAAGFSRAIALTEIEPDVERCQREAGRLLEQATEQLLRARPFLVDRGFSPPR